MISGAMSVFIPGAKEFALFTLFALLIGLVNLFVSFTLALNVALRARNTRISSLPKLIKAWFTVAAENPAALFYPPKDPMPEPVRRRHVEELHSRAQPQVVDRRYGTSTPTQR